MSKRVISDIPNRAAFAHLLQNNPGLIVLKLGAEWCGPCKTIKHVVDGFFATSPENVVCGDIDVDASFDFYSLLKSKKMVNGIPVILCYKKGNLTVIPDDSVTGTDPRQLHDFFTRCGNHLQTVTVNNPPKTTSIRH
jgi:thioredoxin-like negative regulator of GroEL